MTTTSKIIDSMKGKKWYRQACNTKAYYLYTAWSAGIDALKTEFAVAIYKNNLAIEGIYNENDMTKIAKEMINNQRTNHNFIDNYLSKCRIRAKKLQNYYNKYVAVDFKDYQYLQLREIINELEQLWYDYWFFHFICDYFDPGGEELLQKEIQSNGIIFKQNELATLLRSEILSYMQKEIIGELEIAYKIKQGKYTIGSDAVNKFLKKHTLSYYYIDNSWESTKLLTPNDFKEKIERLLYDNSLEDITEQLNYLNTDLKKEHKNLIDKYHINKELSSIIYLFRQLFFLRDERKKYVMLINILFDKIYFRFSQILNIDFKKLNVALASDFKEKFNREEFIASMENRSKFMSISCFGKERVLSEAKEAEKIYYAMLEVFEYNFDEIKGNTASRGKVTGQVRVVMGETHFSKFSKGEILVAPMTRPEYLPLMKNALAIITDEGGITSHAAIVSRELKKPCIIGTKIATKVLSDGDLIEVDADNGIIKKIIK